MAFRQKASRVFIGGETDTAMDSQLVFSPFRNPQNITFGVSIEQIYSPVYSRSGSAPSPGSKSPLASLSSDGRYSSAHLGPTALELNPYFPAEPNTEWDGRNFQEGCDFMFANSNASDTNLSKVSADTIRGMGFRGPMLMSGWGFDIADRPVPSKSQFKFADGIEGDRTKWKTGPVDLKWDEERQVWSGGPHLVCGVVEGGISPGAPCDPSYFTVRVLRLSAEPGSDLNRGTPCETIRVANRDPSLQEEDWGDQIFCIAARINYEWLPIWIGCPDEKKEHDCVDCSAGGSGNPADPADPDNPDSPEIPPPDVPSGTS